jgi:ABC-type proline/glycine betaine transport system ATPase subunit
MICGQENQKILKEIRLIIGSQIQNQGLLHHFKTRILNIMIMPALDLPQKIVLLNL